MKPPFSIRSLLFLFAVSVTLPLVILLAFTLYNAVITQTQNAQNSAVSVAQAAAEDVETFITDTEQHIVGFAAYSDIGTAAKTPAACYSQIQTLLSTMHDAAFVVLLDSQGKPLCSTAPDELTQLPYAKQSWYNGIADQSQATVIPPQNNPVPNRKLFFVGTRVEFAGETKPGVLLVAIESSTLDAILARQHPTNGEIIALLDNQGALLAIAPDPGQLAGANLQTSQLTQSALSNIKGNVQTRGLDGTERIFGFTTIPGKNWRVIAGVPTGSAFAATWQYAAINGLLLLLAILLVAAAARWYSRRIERPINDLLQATDAVAKGDMTARASENGPAELAQLAVQFNTMVDAREAYDHALQQTKEKYRTLIEQIPAVVYRSTSDRDNSALFVNSEINDLLGYTPQEWLSNRNLWAQRVHADDHARVLEELQQLRTTDRPLRLEYRMYARDGKLVHVRDEVRALSQQNGKTRLLQGVIFDVTAQKQAQDKVAYQADLLNQVHDAIIATDARHIVTAWNHAAVEMYGWTEQEALGKNLSEVIHTEISPESARALQEALNKQGSARNLERHYRKTGEPLVIEAMTMTLQDSSGAITGYVSVNRDMTAHQAAEQELERRTAHAEALAHTAAVLNARLELDAVVHAVATETRHALHVSLALLFFYQEDTNRFNLVAASGLSAASFARLKQVPYAYPIALDSPPSLYSRNWASLAMWSNAGMGDIPPMTGALTVPIRHKQEWIGLVCAVTSEEHRAFTAEESQLLGGLADQAALAISNARLFDQVRQGRTRLQTLSRRLVEIQESERHSIARELHDEIGQSLTGLSLVLEMAARASTNGIHSSLNEGQKIVNQIMKQVRNLSLELRPAMLDDLGLLPALTWQVQRYTNQTGIQVDMKLMGLEGKRFTPTVETAAYRIVQEALTNIARYAHVTQAKVRVWIEQENLGIMVEDEGVGFDPNAVTPGAQSSGLIGMRERALLLGGQFVLESVPGHGTRINAKLPLQAFVERRTRERVL